MQLLMHHMVIENTIKQLAKTNFYSHTHNKVVNENTKCDNYVLIIHAN